MKSLGAKTICLIFPFWIDGATALGCEAASSKLDSIFDINFLLAPKSSSEDQCEGYTTLDANRILHIDDEYSKQLADNDYREAFEAIISNKRTSNSDLSSQLEPANRTTDRRTSEGVNRKIPTLTGYISIDPDVGLRIISD